MRISSLRLRLISAGAVAVVTTLLAAAFGLAVLYDRHVERIAVADLNARLEQLAAAMEVNSDGVPVLAAEPTDPRYSRPFSGHYYVISAGLHEFRSRSLWDDKLSLPQMLPPGLPRTIVVGGPNDATLLAVDRTLEVVRGNSRFPIRITVALDRRDLSDLRHEYLLDLLPYMGILATVLTAAGGIQLYIGLRPMAAVSRKVQALNSGGERRLGSDLPDEVKPLAEEIDKLLAVGEAETKRARQRAADLAHGLKTPLQALLAEAQLLRDKGDDAAADGIEEIGVTMQQLVSRELARARMASRLPHGRSDVPSVLEAVVSVLRRTPLSASIAWHIASPKLVARIEQTDLMEAVGALAENAGRHATSQVSVAASKNGEFIWITIDDDGPGIIEEELQNIKKRGVRLDSWSGGDGLGLAIASEIAEAAGGRLELQNGPVGLRATLIIPAA